MIYSKKLQSYIPVQIDKKSRMLPFFGQQTEYTVRDNNNLVGNINVTDTMCGIKVDYIENANPELYSGFGKLADQVEVEHCVKRGLTHFDIVSNAGLNSHALHYLRGKRFYSQEVEDEIKKVIEQTPKGKKFNTEFLGIVRMYMPFEMIEKYLKIIKKAPLLLK